MVSTIYWFKMIKKIFKYPIKVINEQSIKLPCGFKILTIQVQNDNPCIWALVDPEQRTINVKVNTYATGESIDAEEWGLHEYELHGHKYISKTYIGTYQLSGGVLVFHVFLDEPQILPEGWL
jgi:hypothetical protein